MNEHADRLPGARVDTRRKIAFTVDGRRYHGYQGDTLASALLANGVDIVGRSFKLHRPRGILTAGLEETNAFVQLECGPHTEPNARATMVSLYEGLSATGQNAWPSVNRDVGGLLGCMKRLLPASFYYKTMMWPNWHWYENGVRRLAGLGVAPTTSDPQIYRKRNAHCEVLVCGGGPAGLQAALEAGRDGARVMLLDAQEELGGTLLWERHAIDGKPPLQWLQQTLDTLRSMPNVELMPRTLVSGYYDHNFVTAVERVTAHLGLHAPKDQPRERLWRIRAKHVILATGAIERPLVFPNNDLPGIMLAAAVRQYVNRYGVRVGRRVAIFTNNDDAYRTAIDLHDKGIAIAAIVDVRAQGAGTLQAAARARNIPMYLGHIVRAAHGRRKIKSIAVVPHDAGSNASAKAVRIDCDLLAMSGGWSPTLHLYSQANGELRFDGQRCCFVPQACAQAVTVTGAANGDWDTTGERPLEPYWFTVTAPAESQWVDFQYDVTVADIELAARENFVSVEHLKRYTTVGMSVDQGKTSNVNALAILGHLTGRTIPQVGTTRFRPPYHPVTLGAVAGSSVGRLHRAWMEMPAHEWHRAHGGVLEDYGGWLRPAHYGRGTETEHDAISREVHAVRNGVGVFEGSPLGKIEIHGPDAQTFLNRVYVNNILTLKPGRARYGLLLNEGGSVIDDGVLVCLGEQHYLMHTTSGGAGRISQHLEEWLQCEWPDLRVVVNNVTTQWATVTVSGPKARSVVEKLPSDIDFSAAAFPHMIVKQGTIFGTPARVLRASFTGEVSYEINVPANYGLALWEALMELGAEFNITPYGIESVLVMRTEKGYLHVGVDTDSTTTPLDLNWGSAIAKKSEDFIGRRSLSTAEAQRDGRFQFVGLESATRDVPLQVGAHILDGAGRKPRSQGYVTSACFSPTLNKCIGLGLIANGMQRKGEEVEVFFNGAITRARIVAPGFYDVEGARLNG